MKSDLTKNNTSPARTHKEILQLLEEIKEFEKKFGEYDLETIEVDEEIIEVEHEEPKKEEPVPPVEEIKKPKLKEKLKKLKPKHDVKKEKLVTPTTFKLRFNEEGKLENIDIKKFKSKPKTKRHLKLRKSKVEKKEKTEGEVKEETSRLSKLKGGLSKLGRLKKAIPTKSKTSEEKEESKEEV